MKIRVIMASESLRQAAGQIAMLCGSNLKVATTMHQLISWANDCGINKLEFDVISPLEVKLMFQDHNHSAFFHIDAR